MAEDRRVPLVTCIGRGDASNLLWPARCILSPVLTRGILSASLVDHVR